MTKCPSNCNCVKCCASRYNQRRIQTDPTESIPKHLPLFTFGMGCCFALTALGLSSQYKIVAMASLSLCHGHQSIKLSSRPKPLMTSSTKNDFVSMNIWPQDGTIGARMTGVYQLSYDLSGHAISIQDSAKVQIVVIMVRNQNINAPLSRHATLVSQDHCQFTSSRIIHAVLNQGDQVQIMAVSRSPIQIQLEDYNFNALLLKKL